MAGLGTGPWAAALATCEDFVKKKKKRGWALANRSVQAGSVHGDAEQATRTW